ncbi:MAG: hypothetical protein LBJ01_06610 [Tannerella sp.]|jgi:hypothetical protein|nr:hypothetical protein [Tannerella sp.]
MGLINRGVGYSNPKPAFWRGETNLVLPGGFKLLQTFPLKFVIPRGTLCQVNYPDLTAGIVKVAKVIAGGSISAPRVVKGTLFQVGDVVFKEGGTTAKTVTAVDRKNSDYDVLTLDSGISGLTADDIILEAESMSSVTSKYTPNAVVESTKEVGMETDETISATGRATVLEGMAYPVPASFKTGLFLTDNPNILFIYQ